MFNILYLLIFFQNLSFANEPPLEVKAECYSHMSDTGCFEGEIKHARKEAIDQVRKNFDVIANPKIESTIRTCIVATDKVVNQCNTEKLKVLQAEVDALISNFETQKLDSDQKISGFYNSRSRDNEKRKSSIDEIIESLEKLKSEINMKQDLLYELTEHCETEVAKTESDCVKPEVKAEEVNESTAQIGDVVATAQVTQDMVLDVGQIQNDGSDAVLRAHSFANKQIENANKIALPAIEKTEIYSGQIISIIDNLTTLRDQLNPECETTPTGCNNPEPPPKPPEPPTPPPKPNPAIVDNPGRNDVVDTNENEVMNNALNGAYGGQTSTNTQPGNGGFFQNALTGLGSFLGKTSGEFGDKSYYGSSYSNTRSDSESYNSAQNRSVDYKAQSNRNYAPNEIPYSQTGNQGRSNPRSIKSYPNGQAINSDNSSSQGNASSVSGSNLGSISPSGSGSSNDQDSKPSLFTKLFGSSDKNMFGKSSTNNGGSEPKMEKKGYQKSYRGRSLGEENNSVSSKNRIFDYDKYRPSPTAEQRAYERATGRRIASRSIANSSGFEWPNDIRKNKNSNLFKIVNIIHRSKLAH